MTKLTVSKRHLFLLTSAAFFMQSPSLAQSIDHASFEALFNEPVTTSANGTPQRASDAAIDIHILSAEQIKRTGARTLPDALKHVPGLQVRQFSESHLEVGIRGNISPYNDRILVLVNGRQVFLDYFGLVVWESIPVQFGEIRQIEVIKGPNHALFGFNAVSGVINIVTYNPLYDNIDNASFTMGSHEYVDGSVVSTVKTKNGGIRVSAGGMHMDRFDKSPKSNSGLFTGNSFENAIGNHRESGSITGALTGQFNLNGHTNWGYELTQSKLRRNEIPSGFIHARYQTRSYKGNFSSETPYGIVEGKLYRNEVEAADINLDFNNVTVAELSHSFKVGTDHTFRSLVEWRDNRSSVIGDEVNDPSSDNQIVFNYNTFGGLWHWNISEKLSLNNALRYDHITYDFKGEPPSGVSFTENDYDRQSIEEISFNSGLLYKHDGFNRIRLNVARGLDLPSHIEISLQAPSSRGTPTIEPAIINDYQFGYERDIDAYDMSIGATAFYQESRNVQNTFLDGSTTIFTNSGNYYANGIELAANGTVDLMRWGVNYTHIGTENEINDPSRNFIYDNNWSENIANVNLGFSYNQFDADAFLTWYDDYTVQRSTSSGIVEDPIKSHTSLNFNITYHASEQTNLSLSGKNLLQGHRQNSVMELEPQLFFNVTHHF